MIIPMVTPDTPGEPDVIIRAVGDGLTDDQPLPF